MDPSLREMLDGDADDEVEVVLRLAPGAPPPPGVRVVAEIGDVVTGRVRRGDIVAVRAEDVVYSMKAAKFVGPDPWADAGTGTSRRPDVSETGRGVLVAAVDWGCDFAHPDFRHPDGTTRIVALWDQSGPSDRRSPRPYGYGRVHTAADIDRALRAEDPYQALGYHPGVADPGGSGAHGTHVLSIAGGSNRDDGGAGMAPDADLAFVHLASRRAGDHSTLGDSVTIIEACHFLDRVAGDRSLVINASVGQHGGPHDGTTLVERALDHLVSARPGRCVVQSCGNYYERDIHASGHLVPGERRTLRWEVDDDDATPNELEIWYSGEDRFGLAVALPGVVERVAVPPGGPTPLNHGGRQVGRAYHRLGDPNNGGNQIDVFLDAGCPGGSWEIELHAADVVDGRFDAWVERDATCPGCQSRFADADADPVGTTGTICNGRRTIAVGAFDGNDPDGPIAPFSSSGPTRDGRHKPDVLAPGVAVRAARSTPPDADRPVAGYTAKSGTSMAAPYVAGTAACMFEAAGGPLGAAEIRAALASTARRTRIPPERAGAGAVDPAAAVTAVRRTPDHLSPRGPAMTREPVDPARLFDQIVYRLSPPEGFEVVGVPGAAPTSVPRPDDLVIWRGLGEAGLARAFTITETVPDHTGLVAQVVADGATTTRGLLGPDGRLGADHLVLRRQLGEVELPVEAGPSCSPAPEPNPGGKGPHPLVRQGPAVRSRRPAVGYAQECLNNFLVLHRDGKITCPANDPATQRFITEQLAALARERQLPLVVDCKFGPSTDRATKAFQACQGIKRDGQIGEITWPLLEALAAPYSLFVDADRDGTVDAVAAPATWQWGAAGRGAIILVNNDDDGVNGKPDNEDAAVDTGADNTELAPLVLERPTGTGVATGVTVELRVSDKDSIRVFPAGTAGTSEVIGPGAGATHSLPSPPAQRLDMFMEGVRYPGPGFPGEITVTLRVLESGRTLAETSTVVRVAPWLMPNHLDSPDKVFVVNAGSFNTGFRTRLATLATAAGATVVESPAGAPATHGDVWMQDCMEFGFANLPATGFRAVMRSPQIRDLEPMARSLLDADMGFLAPGTVAGMTSYDSTGNLECTPPCTSAAGKHFPLGRVYFGPGTPVFDQFDQDVEDFLRAQVVQDPIEVDTTWLAVGHVDEVISFVPASGSPGFKLLLASPRTAYTILDGLRAAHGGDKILVGRKLLGTTGALNVNVERKIKDFLVLNDDFHPGVAALPTHTTRKLRDYNNDLQTRIDGVRSTMKTELGLADADIIELPVVFSPNDRDDPDADALTGNVVNMVVLSKHCVVPKPFGPVVGGVDQFEKDVTDKLTPLGLTVGFIDCWNNYHVRLGEVHCGTNMLRARTRAPWWEFQP